MVAGEIKLGGRFIRPTSYLPVSNSSSFAPWIVAIDPSARRSAERLALGLALAKKSGFRFALSDRPDHFAADVKRAQQAGLQLLLKVAIDRAARISEAVTLGDDAGEALPDPRYPHARKPEVRPQEERAWAAFSKSQVAACVEQLVSFAQDGARGFCLSLEGFASPAFFRQLIAAAKVELPGCVFIAWSLGVSAERVSSMVDCGFDAAVGSGAWWDFRSGWLLEECERLRPFGCLIGTASRVDSGSSGCRSTLPAEATNRSLWLVAATSDGVLISSTCFDQPPDASRQAALAALRDRAEASVTADRPIAACCWKLISDPGSCVASLLVESGEAGAGSTWLLVINTAPFEVSDESPAWVARLDGLTVTEAGGCRAGERPTGAASTLAPFEIRVHQLSRNSAIRTAEKQTKRGADAAVRQAAQRQRIAIENLAPSVDEGRFRVKRQVGERVQVEVDIFGEGHDLLAATLRWRAADASAWRETPLTPTGNDHWIAEFSLDRVGRFQFEVQAWLDLFGAYRDEIGKKHTAGQQIELELQEGLLRLEEAASRARQSGLTEAVESLTRASRQIATATDPAFKVQVLLADELHATMKLLDPRPFSVTSSPLREVDSERRAAGFASWYECFPRSLGPDPLTHGQLRDVLARLPAIRRMGFDTLYFPPIHPVGMRHRKGRNNALSAAPGEPGSPYAIGAAEGGHDAIHPQLGTLDDFRELVREARAHGLELALDFAIQCSPDHPWLQAHPEWFSWRPDGTVRYAENPPKKYQDIVNVDFYAEGAVPSLWLALRDIVLFWIREGVHVFRVDNPHTKPMPFWEWMIGEVRARFPEVIFLAEAFTRPKPMYRLAKLGFSQSYTYFTWRHSKAEFIAYLTELSQGAPREFFRPHFFVNTPDINPYFLQRAGRAGFVIRAALAATLSGLWGMYSGFELCESEPVPGKEEYLDSEKYELKHRNWNQPGNIIGEISLLNRIRRANPALHSHLNVRFCASSGDAILCFTKTAGHNHLFVAICLDPHGIHDCEVELPVHDWGARPDSELHFEDLVTGAFFTQQGARRQVRLDPAALPFCVWRLNLPESR